MKRGINSKSKGEAMRVMAYLYENKITRIHTRGAIDRMIEMVKFPETRFMSSFGGRSLKSNKVTAYKNQQYDPIRCYLIRKGYLKQYFDGYRYHYIVINK